MAEFKLGRIKFVYQGAWAQNRSYVVDDVITNSGKTYICVISHTSTNATTGFTTDSTGGAGITKWNLIADGTTWRNSWAAATYYNLGDMVLYGGIVYLCKTAHTSATSTASITATGLTVSSGTATLTYSTQAVQPFLVGATITLAGFSPASTSGSVNTVNSTFTVVTCTTTQLTFALTGTYTVVTLGTVSGTSQLGLETDQGKWDAFASNFNWSGSWATSTRYKVRDLIYYGGSTYVCNQAHISATTATSGLEADSGKWSVFNQGITYLGDWSGSSVRYKLNDVVKFGPDLWICTTYHTSTGVTIDVTNFAIFVNGFTFEGSWGTGTEYQIGDVVTYGGYTYTALQNSGSADPKIPSTQPAYWQLFTTGLVFTGDWNTNTSYKIGSVVTLGGYSYLAVADNSATQPPGLSTATFTGSITGTALTTSSPTGTITVGMTVTGGTVAAGTVIISGSGSSWVVSSSQIVASASLTGTITFWGKLNSGIRWASAPNTTYTNVASSTVSATGSGSPTFTVTRAGTIYSAVIGTTPGTGYTVNDTLKVLGSALGGATPGNDLVVKVATITGGGGTGPIATVTVLTGYAATWKTGITYVTGDAVYYGNSSFICISAHVGSTGVNDPITDTGTYWNILASGSNSGKLTTQGDMVYYGTNGPTRLPIGTDGQILRVNVNKPEWQYYGQLQNIVYVAPNGTDASGNGQGLTLDKPWASLLYASQQIEEGYLNTNAGLSLKVNKQFMMKEVNNYILTTYSFNVTGTSASGNTFTVGSTSTTSQVTTANMYYGMPITFSIATGGITAGTVYYVNTIPTSTTFTISEVYQSGSTRAITPNSVTASVARFDYTQSKAERDAGTVIDGIIFDLTHGGNLYSTTATKAYFKTLTSFTSTGTTQQAPVFAGSLVYLKDTLIPAILANTAPAANYQTLNGISTKAIQNTISVTTSTVEAGALSTAQGLLGIITSALTAGTYGNIPQEARPHTTIYLKTGTYNEYGPIVVPVDTAVVGDELRSTIVQMSKAQTYLINDKPKTSVALQRMQSVMANLIANTTITPTTAGTIFPNTATQVTTLPAGDTGNASAVNLVVTNIRTIQDMFAGGGVITGPTNPNYPKGLLHQPAISMPTVTGYNSSYLANYGDAVTLIQANYQFIKDEIVSFLNTDGNLTGSAQWSSYSDTYKAETLRDLTNMLDAICYDMTYGCNSQSLITGSSYC